MSSQGRTIFWGAVPDNENYPEQPFFMRKHAFLAARASAIRSAMGKVSYSDPWILWVGKRREGRGGLLSLAAETARAFGTIRL